MYGVTALQYVGGEVPVDPMTTERIEVVDAGTGRIESETYIEKPGELALDRNGQLYAISDHTIVKVDLAGGGHRPFVTDLIEPTTLAFDSANNLYVFDGAKDRKVVRVYDQDGKHVRDIGTPGGYVAGPWTGTRFGNVTSITIDRTDQLWVVERGYQPKRISLWTLDGKLKREFLGNTQYGGGGVLDPYDKRRLFYQNMEFELDWKTGATRLKNLTWLGNSRAAEVPVHINDRCYMVTRPSEGSRNEQPCGIVYIYDKGRLRRVAAVGGGNGFPPLNNPDVRKKMGDKGLTAFWFTWTDRNGDEYVQADEVTLWETETPRIGIGLFNRDLGIQAGDTRYAVKEFLPNGAPVYEARHFPKVEGRAIYKLDNDTFFRMAPMDPNVPQAGISPDGKYLWTYKTEGSGVHSLYRAKPMHPGQVVSEFSWIGHETAHAGDLGEFVVTHSNVGAWNIWTADGLLAGRIFRDIRDPKAVAWSMRDHQRGLRLENVTAGQEHFQGYFCRTLEDDKYYVVAGHNHASVVEVGGIDKFRRLRGTFTVTPESLRTAQAWEFDQQNKQAYERGSVIDCFRSKNPVRIDGSPDDWELASAEIEGQARFRVTYDDKYLYLCYETSNMGPMKNTGEQWDRLFKTGASVDLQMSVDSNADDARRGPVAGDFRLLMTKTGKKFTAVIYRPVVPGTAQRDEWEVISPVSRVAFDQVKKLDDVRMACRGGDKNYCFEAVVPLKTIGLKITPDLRLRFDWGVLVSGKDGNEVLRRVYWSNKATSIVADAPSEAALHPDLWGHIRFHEKDTAAPDIFDPMADPDADTEPDEDVIDFIDDLEEDLK